MPGELLMPKATAIWLVDNTSLTFDQIAQFCSLHPLEVKAIADDDAAVGIKGLDPVATGQLSREEIDRAQNDPTHKLVLSDKKVRVPTTAKKKGPRYVPVSKRQDRPNAILWLLRSHPELKDAQIMRLVGTTKPTIQSIRDRTHWNSPNLQPLDPVSLGLCSQVDLDNEVKKAAKDAPVVPESEHPVDTLLPAEETTTEDAIAAALSAASGLSSPSSSSEEEEIDADAVFSKLKSLKRDDEDPED